MGDGALMELSSAAAVPQKADALLLGCQLMGSTVVSMEHFYYVTRALPANFGKMIGSGFGAAARLRRLAAMNTMLSALALDAKSFFEQIDRDHS